MNSWDEGQLNMFGNNTFEVIHGEGESLDEIINVSKMSYIESNSLTWRDLFRGFNDIKVITFSYGLKFIETVMHLFNTGEIIIGCENLINKSAAELFAIQEFATRHIANNNYLQQRISNGEFRFYVVKDLVSHQKIYLLKSEDGRVRTIFGSANMSEIAWNGEQIESYFYSDDISFYEDYLKKYETLKDFSTDKISVPAVPIKASEDDLVELPIMKTIEKKGTIVVTEPDSNDEPEYAFTKNRLSQKWENAFKDAKIKPDKNGKTLIKTSNLFDIKKNFDAAREKKKEREKVSPPFELDYNEKTAKYKDEFINLNPSGDDVKKDISNLLKYMSGFDKFTNDTVKLKKSYWKILNYMFLSPFMAKLRYEADSYKYDKRFFPIYLLIQGVSDAGKTAFVETVQRLMYGETLPKLDKTFFSSKPMAGLKETVKGCTLLIDELTPTYWKYAREIVKADDYLAKNGFINHPAFVMTSNEVKSVAADLSKRIIYVNVNNRLGKEEAALNDKYISNLRNSMSNAFYGEYLKHMFDAVENLIDKMKSCDDEHWYPDIFEISTSIIKGIISKYNFDIPKELEDFKWIDYMGESVISEKAINMLKDEFEHNKGIFKVNKNNKLEVDFSGYDKTDAEIKVKVLEDELPAKLECKAVGLKVIMKNEFVEEYVGITVKRKFWDMR